MIWCGGKCFDWLGWFYLLIVIIDIFKDMVFYIEEVFGLVVLVFCVVNIDEVVEIVNVIIFGLGFNVWICDEIE